MSDPRVVGDIIRGLFNSHSFSPTSFANVNNLSGVELVELDHGRLNAFYRLIEDRETSNYLKVFNRYKGEIERYLNLAESNADLPPHWLILEKQEVVGYLGIGRTLYMNKVIPVSSGPEVLHRTRAMVCKVQMEACFYIVDVTILRARRGNNIAEKACYEIMRLASAQGIEEVYFKILKDNTIAAAWLNKKIGAALVGELPGKYLERLYVARTLSQTKS